MYLINYVAKDRTTKQEIKVSQKYEHFGTWKMSTPASWGSFTNTTRQIYAFLFFRVFVLHSPVTVF